MNGPRYHRILAGMAFAVVLAALFNVFTKGGKSAAVFTGASPAGQASTETSSAVTATASEPSAATAAAISAKPTGPTGATEQSMAPDSLASLDPADRAVAEKIRDLLAAKSDAIFANKNERMAVDAFYQSRNLAPLWLDRGVENARATAEARAAAAKTGELPLDYMLRIMRDPKPSNTRRDEMARTAAPYLHPKIGVTEFVAPPRLGDDNEIRIVFVDPQGRHVPFKPPPELEAAATGPNTPQQLDLDRSEEDRQLLTR